MYKLTPSRIDSKGLQREELKKSGRIGQGER